VVGLSATVSNAEEFGDWLVAVRGDTTVVVDEHRPVPLWQHMMVNNRLFDLFAGEDNEGRLRVDPALIRHTEESARPFAGWGDRSRGRSGPRRGGRSGGPRGGDRFRPPSRVTVIDRLDRDALLPAITFVFSRAGCEAAVAQCARSGLRLTTEDEVSRIREIVATRTAGLPEGDLAVLGFWEWRDALEKGIAAHHAGMLPAFKETVEELFTLGLVKCVFATETLALGINMPARTVVLERLVKYNGEAHVELTAGEYTQLTGRPGGAASTSRATPLWSGSPGWTRPRSPGWPPPAPTRCAARSGPATTWPSTCSTGWALSRPGRCWSSPSRSSRRTARWSGCRAGSSATTRRWPATRSP